MKNPPAGAGVPRGVSGAPPPPLLDDGPGTLRQLVSTLVRLPEPVRAFAQQHVAVVVAGGTSRGCVLPRAALDGAEWVVVLAAGDSLPDVFAHELAHALEPHLVGLESERAAAALARAWGFAGPSASPVEAERAYREGAAREAAPSLRADVVSEVTSEVTSDVKSEVTSESLHLACATCGRPARFLAPTAPGVRAVLCAECPRCAGVALVALEDLVPCQTCGGRCRATWSEGASPASPRATWACHSCGEVAVREVLAAQESPAPSLPVPEDPEAARLQMAAAAMLRTEERLRALGSGPDACALESCRAAVWWARGLVVRAAADLAAGDVREPFVRDAAEELSRAGRALAAGGLGPAADAVAEAARVLDALGVAATVET